MTMGVYAVIEEETGKIIYIGSSKNTEERWRIHFRELRRRISLYKNMQRIYDCLGFEGLAVVILEETSLDERFVVEKKWTGIYEPIDNIMYTARQKEVNEKISRALTGKIPNPEAIEKTRLTNIGRVRSKEVREHWSRVRTGKKASEETKARMTKSQLERWVGIKEGVK